MAGVSPFQIWSALTRAGASAVQAAGIMGNMIAESSLNPESSSIDSNGYRSNGLVQWNTASYPNSGSLITGDPQADLQSQVNFLTTTGGLQAASGTTVAETAGNFAAGYERCQGCQPGGSQYDQRVANAQQVAGWAASGRWPAGSAQATTTATLTSADAAGAKEAASECLWSIGWGSGSGGTPWWEYLISPAVGIANDTTSGQICLISKPQARAVLGSLILAGGITITALGVVLLLASSGMTGPALLGKVAAPAAAIAGAVGAPRGAVKPSRGRGSTASVLWLSPWGDACRGEW